jgi:hypothetical protein
MKIAFLIVLLFACLSSRAQLIHRSDGEYIDTTGRPGLDCKEIGLYYYQVGAKYPRSSRQLLLMLTDSYGNDMVFGNQSGFITFQFVIDCEGRLVKHVKVLQADMNYLPTQFPYQAIKELYTFILSLADWKKIVLNDGKSYPYHSFFTFKIIDGKVKSIIP